jgi:hypothetical protein
MVWRGPRSDDDGINTPSPEAVMHTLSVLVNRLQTLRGAAWRAAPGVAARRAQAAPPDVVPDDIETDTDATAQACGWFDSSHALHCGLHVTEHTNPDALATQLPLDAWLEWHLAGRITAPAVHAD